jgi:thiol:disulfide interchange protein DsbD
MLIRTHIFCRLLLGLVLLVVSSIRPAMADEFLTPEKAFAFTSTVLDAQTVRLRWVIAPGYHLYRDRISVQSNATGVKWDPLTLPEGKDEFDANFNKTLAVFRDTLEVNLHLTQGNGPVQLTIGWQGCADAGLCYSPDSAALQMTLAGLIGARYTADKPIANQAAEQSGKAQEAPDSIASTLASGSLLKTMGVFWLAGLLLAFTPCVLPMVPILSSLIAGQTGTVSRTKGFSLALAYSLGMALIYAGFGVAAGLAGEGLAAALQNPWVLGSFAVLLSTLAMSMFGFYELQMPSAIQSRATDWSNSFKGGSYAGVFIMGGVSALVVGPCVAAPLAGALVYISQTHDVVLGGLALFAMALGMSVPLLLVGVSAGSLLPRAGAWMERVKQVFGMMLLGVAIWMVTPVLPGSVQMLLWAIWLLTASALLGVLGPASPQHSPTPVAARTAGLGLLALAVLLLLGAASGGQSVLQPLAHIRTAQAGNLPEANTGLQFERIKTVAGLEAALGKAQAKGQPVMLDFYADWCVSCKEFETFTFSNAEVKKRLSPVLLLQADVTANNADDKALLKRFNLFGPPGIVFFKGAEVTQVIHKVVGYQNANDFLASLSTAAIH